VCGDRARAASRRTCERPGSTLTLAAGRSRVSGPTPGQQSSSRTIALLLGLLPSMRSGPQAMENARSLYGIPTLSYGLPAGRRLRSAAQKLARTSPGRGDRRDEDIRDGSGRPWLRPAQLAGMTVAGGCNSNSKTVDGAVGIGRPPPPPGSSSASSAAAGPCQADYNRAC